MATTDQRPRAPVNDAIIIAVSRLVDDAQTETREPSHSDIEFQISRAGLIAGDPKSQGQVVGKAKRVRGTLSWALENAPDKAEVFVAALIGMLRGKGTFRKGSPNYAGDDPIVDAIEAFRCEGFELTEDGELHPISLDTLDGAPLTEALEAYVRRARRGSEDAALLVGIGKDLLEATAAHVISARFGQYPKQANFPTLLGQAFIAVGLATPLTPPTPGESPQCRLERAMYEAGCAVNALRNKEGIGHGRPWLPNVSESDARAAIQLMGIISGFLLGALK
jgi:Abortive infection C-terminus